MGGVPGRLRNPEHPEGKQDPPCLAGPKESQRSRPSTNPDLCEGSPAYPEPTVQPPDPLPPAGESTDAERRGAVATLERAISAEVARDLTRPRQTPGGLCGTPMDHASAHRLLDPSLEAEILPSGSWQRQRH